MSEKSRYEYAKSRLRGDQNAIDILDAGLQMTGGEPPDGICVGPEVTPVMPKGMRKLFEEQADKERLEKEQ